MTREEFAELVSYVSRNIEHDLDRWALRIMNEDRCPLPSDVADSINDYAEEWCNENDIDPDEYWSDYDAEDVFFHDNYAFDA